MSYLLGAGHWNQWCERACTIWGGEIKLTPLKTIPFIHLILDRQSKIQRTGWEATKKCIKGIISKSGIDPGQILKGLAFPPDCTALYFLG